MMAPMPSRLAPLAESPVSVTEDHGEGDDDILISPSSVVRSPSTPPDRLLLSPSTASTFATDDFGPFTPSPIATLHPWLPWTPSSTSSTSASPTRTPSSSNVQGGGSLTTSSSSPSQSQREAQWLLPSVAAIITRRNEADEDLISSSLSSLSLSSRQSSSFKKTSRNNECLESKSSKSVIHDDEDEDDLEVQIDSKQQPSSLSRSSSSSSSSQNNNTNAASSSSSTRGIDIEIPSSPSSTSGIKPSISPPLMSPSSPPQSVAPIGLDDIPVAVPLTSPSAAPAPMLRRTLSKRSNLLYTSTEPPVHVALVGEIGSGKSASVSEALASNQVVEMTGGRKLHVLAACALGPGRQFGTGLIHDHHSCGFKAALLDALRLTALPGAYSSLSTPPDPSTDLTATLDALCSGPAPSDGVHYLFPIDAPSMDAFLVEELMAVGDLCPPWLHLLITVSPSAIKPLEKAESWRFLQVSTIWAKTSFATDIQRATDVLKPVGILLDPLPDDYSLPHSSLLLARLALHASLSKLYGADAVLSTPDNPTRVDVSAVLASAEAGGSDAVTACSSVLESMSLRSLLPLDSRLSLAAFRDILAVISQCPVALVPSTLHHIVSVAAPYSPPLTSPPPVSWVPRGLLEDLSVLRALDLVRTLLPSDAATTALDLDPLIVAPHAQILSKWSESLAMDAPSREKGRSMLLEAVREAWVHDDLGTDPELSSVVAAMPTLVDPNTLPGSITNPHWISAVVSYAPRPAPCPCWRSLQGLFGRWFSAFRLPHRKAGSDEAGETALVGLLWQAIVATDATLSREWPALPSGKTILEQLLVRVNSGLRLMDDHRTTSGFRRVSSWVTWTMALLRSKSSDGRPIIPVAIYPHSLLTGYARESLDTKLQAIPDGWLLWHKTQTDGEIGAVGSSQRAIVKGSLNGSVEVRDPITMSLAGHTVLNSPVRGVALLPSGSVVVGLESGEAAVFSGQGSDFRLVKRWRASESSILKVVYWAKDAAITWTQFITIARDGRVVVWEHTGVDQVKEVISWAGSPGGLVTATAVLPPRHFALATVNIPIHLYNVAKGGRPELVLRGHAGWISALTPLGLDHLVSGGGSDGRIIVHNVQNGGPPLGSWEAHPGGVSALGVAWRSLRPRPDNAWIVSTGADATFRVWCMALSGALVVTIPLQAGPLTSANLITGLLTRYGGERVHIGIPSALRHDLDSDDSADEDEHYDSSRERAEGLVAFSGGHEDGVITRGLMWAASATTEPPSRTWGLDSVPVRALGEYSMPGEDDGVERVWWPVDGARRLAIAEPSTGRVTVWTMSRRSMYLTCDSWVGEDDGEVGTKYGALQNEGGVGRKWRVSMADGSDRALLFVRQAVDSNDISATLWVLKMVGDDEGVEWEKGAHEWLEASSTVTSVSVSPEGSCAVFGMSDGSALMWVPPLEAATRERAASTTSTDVNGLAAPSSRPRRASLFQRIKARRRSSAMSNSSHLTPPKSSGGFMGRRRSSVFGGGGVETEIVSVFAMRASPGAVSRVKWVRRDTILVEHGADGLVEVWGWTPARREEAQPPNALHAVALDASGPAYMLEVRDVQGRLMLATSSTKGGVTAHRWTPTPISAKMASGGDQDEFGEGGPVTAWASGIVIGGGHALLTGHADGYVRRWNLVTGTRDAGWVLKPPRSARGPVRALMALSGPVGGDYIIGLLGDGTLAVWSLLNLSLLVEFRTCEAGTAVLSGTVSRLEGAPGRKVPPRVLVMAQMKVEVDGAVVNPPPVIMCLYLQ